MYGSSISFGLDADRLLFSVYYKLYDAESTARPVLKKNADYLPLNNPSIGRIDISNVRFTNDMDKLARIIAVHEDLLETYESGGADLFPDDNSEIPLVGGLPPSLGSLQSDPVVIVFKENIQQERDKKKSGAVIALVPVLCPVLTMRTNSISRRERIVEGRYHCTPSIRRC